MTEEELLTDFIDFLKKQLRYGSSKAPRLDAMLENYTGNTRDMEIISQGLTNLGAIQHKADQQIIDMSKINDHS